MAKPADADGEALDAGSLYRLVPNWSSHWDYARNIPEPRAFRKDGDIGVSMLIKERMAVEEIHRLKPQTKPYGICELAVEELLTEDDVWVRLDHDELWGDAHVIVMGITKRRIDWLRQLGMRNIVHYPAPAKPDDR